MIFVIRLLSSLCRWLCCSGVLGGRFWWAPGGRRTTTSLVPLLVKSRIKEHSLKSQRKEWPGAHTNASGQTPSTPISLTRSHFLITLRSLRSLILKFFFQRPGVRPVPSRPVRHTLRTKVECLLIFLIWTSFQALEDNWSQDNQCQSILLRAAGA